MIGNKKPHSFLPDLCATVPTAAPFVANIWFGILARSSLFSVIFKGRCECGTL
jgi:hypothetical protein